MTQLRFVQVDAQADGGTAAEDWRHVHNTIIPSSPLTLDDVRERSGRNLLEVAYLDGVLVGCSTVRSPTDEDAATVIARTLPAHRGRGIGTALYERGLARARERAVGGLVETVVWEANTEGLRFALSHGFEETDRYVLPGDDVPWITLAQTFA
ncbi:GNAT family N-acetyltransferase [Streptomyces sp. NA04227]|uniref:GNAT family N-acetyltransferase n=1 Tax=Streptomyces sp. NA04227 TaxID=2742136 RepID=UPI0015921A48|nr:GNAT family N-acetyltransferase [Streptomyces sp. NA04227]QKW08702.1 GNAT family N-acetyltransferase [Streptomyces sp. NA04227]